ncbi:hypothetical protein AWC24_06210 [Mycolicibacter senuensis]|nr:hypothetical protein AWC24_06210 [Mycolicibacter senuensis]
MLVIYGDFVHHQMNIGAILATTICVYFPLFAGYWDASWNYPVARGHRLQLTILTIMTAGIFAALYFPGFYLGKRWPRRPKRSMEYRIHPRHWELDDGDLP